MKQETAPLPIIQNYKSIQNKSIVFFETVIGKLIEIMPKSQFLVVNKSRFAPIKSLKDLDQARTTQPRHIVIQSNSPGELSHWVAPICNAFKRANIPIEIDVFLTPCQYASGTEVDYARSLPNVRRVFTPNETIKALLTAPFIQKKSNEGAVLYLGRSRLRKAIKPQVWVLCFCVCRASTIRI